MGYDYFPTVTVWRHGKVLPSIIDLEEGGEGEGEGEGGGEGERRGGDGGGEGGGEGDGGGERDIYGCTQLHHNPPAHLALELAVKCLPVHGRHPAQLRAVHPLEVIKLHVRCTIDVSSHAGHAPFTTEGVVSKVEHGIHSATW